MKLPQGWKVFTTIMITDDIPFKDKPEELIPTEEDLDELRNGFDSWMERQEKLI